MRYDVIYFTEDVRSASALLKGSGLVLTLAIPTLQGQLLTGETFKIVTIDRLREGLAGVIFRRPVFLGMSEGQLTDREHKWIAAQRRDG